MTHHGVEIPKDRIAAFCRKHHIQKLALFGSILSEEFRADSDIDILVEFEPEQTPSLLGMAGLELELTEMLGRKVDLRTRWELSRYFREEVVQSAEVQYAPSG